MAIPTSSSDLTKEYLNSVLEDFQEIVKVKHFGFAFIENCNIPLPNVVQHKMYTKHN